MVCNRRYYTDQYGNEWMAYDSEPLPFIPSRRQRVMLPRREGN